MLVQVVIVPDHFIRHTLRYGEPRFPTIHPRIPWGLAGGRVDPRGRVLDVFRRSSAFGDWSADYSQRRSAQRTRAGQNPAFWPFVLCHPDGGLRRRALLLSRGNWSDGAIVDSRTPILGLSGGSCSHRRGAEHRRQETRRVGGNAIGNHALSVCTADIRPGGGRQPERQIRVGRFPKRSRF